MSKILIPLSRPSIDDLEISAVTNVLKSGVLSLGEEVPKFESDFESYLKKGHAVAVSSGTAALHLSMILSNIETGDEVITTPFSFVATVNAVLYANAKLRLVDIDEQTLGINADLIESAISSATKAIVPVHVFGQLCNIHRCVEITSKHNLWLIEDACEALGTHDQDQFAGTFGQFGTFGFYPNKQLTTGEGGMLWCKDAEVAEKARSIRNQGRRMGTSTLIHDELGYNYRMSEIQAAIGRVQLEKLNKHIEKRELIFSYYQHELGQLEEIKLPKKLLKNRTSWFVYVIQVNPNRRDALINYLVDKGIQSKPYFDPCIHQQPYFIRLFGDMSGYFPVAEQVSKSSVALPFYPEMTESELKTVINAIKNFFTRSMV